jgi:predicted RNase H-like HicB family nuclease
MCAALGLSKGEILRMADVVLDVWKEALVQYAAKSDSGARDSFMEDRTD